MASEVRQKGLATTDVVGYYRSLLRSLESFGIQLHRLAAIGCNARFKCENESCRKNFAVRHSPAGRRAFHRLQKHAAVDWNSRIGSYTYDQTVTDLGPPDKQTKLTDGKTVAEWVTHRNGGSGVSFGTGFFSGGAEAAWAWRRSKHRFGPSGQNSHAHLRTDNKLLAVSKNY